MSEEVTKHSAMLAALVQIALQASATAIRALHRTGEVSAEEIDAIHGGVRQLANGLADVLPDDMVHRIRAASDLFP